MYKLLFILFIIKKVIFRNPNTFPKPQQYANFHKETSKSKTILSNKLKQGNLPQSPSSFG